MPAHLHKVVHANHEQVSAKPSNKQYSKVHENHAKTYFVPRDSLETVLYLAFLPNGCR